MLDPFMISAFSDELTKTALLERLIRLGATDIPGTPRLFMRKRSPEELGSLQQGVQGWWNRNITDRVGRPLKPLINRIPEGRVKNYAARAVTEIARDPVGATVTNLAPIPGAFEAYVAGKKGLEYGIDKLFPIKNS